MTWKKGYGETPSTESCQSKTNLFRMEFIYSISLETETNLNES